MLEARLYKYIYYRSIQLHTHVIYVLDLTVLELVTI